MVPGSNPNHTIYVFIVKSCTIFVIALRKGQKLTKRDRVWAIFQNTKRLKKLVPWLNSKQNLFQHLSNSFYQPKCSTELLLLLHIVVWKWTIHSHFFVFSNYNQFMWNNVLPVYGAGIRTHDLKDTSLLPLPLHHGSCSLLPIVTLTYQFSLNSMSPKSSGNVWPRERSLQFSFSIREQIASSWKIANWKRLFHVEAQFFWPTTTENFQLKTFYHF